MLSPFQLRDGRWGRAEKPPPQLGQTLFNTLSTQFLQNVHSNEQIMASVDSGGNCWLQCSHVGRNSSIDNSIVAWLHLEQQSFSLPQCGRSCIDLQLSFLPWRHFTDLTIQKRACCSSLNPFSLLPGCLRQAGGADTPIFFYSSLNEAIDGDR